MVKPLVVIMNSDREHFFGMILTNNIVIEDLAKFFRCRDAVTPFHQRGLILLSDDVHAQFDTFVADVGSWTGDELAQLLLALAAEGAIERFPGIAVASLDHLRSSTRCESSL